MLSGYECLRCAESHRFRHIVRESSEAVRLVTAALFWVLFRVQVGYGMIVFFGLRFRLLAISVLGAGVFE